MSDNYMTESAMEAEAMHKAYTEARENWVVFEAAAIAFLAGGFLVALAVRYQSIAVTAFAVGVAVGLALVSAYWRRKMKRIDWD